MEEFVNRKEFEVLREEVNIIKKDMVESQKLLQAIDKKIDIINEKIITSDKIDELKFNPLQERIKKIEDSNTWLWRTIGGTILGIAVKVIIDLAH